MGSLCIASSTQTSGGFKHSCLSGCQASSVPFTVLLTELLQFPAYLGPDQLPACLLSLLLEAFLELLSLALFHSQGVLQLLKLLLWHHVVYLGLGLLQLQSMLGLGQAQACFGFQKL